MRGIRLGLLASATSLALARGAIAGQVFVAVNNPASFQSGSVLNGDVPTLNVGDHVIWRWNGSGHTVTSGNISNGVKSNIFDSSPTNSTFSQGTFFTWKTAGAGPVPYFCIPHRDFGMVGRVVFPVANTAEADLRITEVRFDGDVGSNFVEITNLGDAAADLAGFRLVINGTTSTLSSLVPPLNPLAQALFVAVAGLTTATPEGDVALYAPHTIANSVGSTNSLDDARMMVDYVEWGTSGGKPRESTAAATTQPVLWTAGDFAPKAAAGHSIVFCGIRGQHGRSFWDETTNPTPGAVNDCVSPVTPTTWGNIKTLYR